MHKWVRLVKFFNFKYNFDQTTQKKIKKAMLFGKINSNNANYHDIIMMPKTNAPIHSYESPQIYYQPPKSSVSFSFSFFGNLFLKNDAPYDDSDRDPVPAFWNGSHAITL